MKRIRLAVFGGTCDAIELSETKSSEAIFEITPRSDGYLMLGDYSFAVKDGVCKADLRGLEDGEFSAFFYTASNMYTLPKLEKTGRTVSILPPDADYVIELAARCRELDKRLAEHENKLAELEELIKGGRLAIGESEE